MVRSAPTGCRLLLPAALLFWLGLPADASTVTRDTLRSAVAGRDMCYTVICPDRYAADASVRYPVLYLLHPLSSTDSFWLEPTGPATQLLMDSVHFIAVIPHDGTGQSWWLDSPKMPASFQLSTYLAAELKPCIDVRYRTLPDRRNTGIAGQSMGGFGAVHNRIEHAAVFGPLLMLKAAIDLRWPLNPHWPSFLRIDVLLGSAPEDSVNYQRVNPFYNSSRLRGEAFPFRIYCGVQDASFYDENLRYHRLLDSLGIVHEYIEVDEQHGGCTTTRMGEVLHFFDTAFVYGNAAVAPQHRLLPAAGAGRTGAVLHGLDGRRLTAAAATHRASAVVAAGSGRVQMLLR